MTIVEELKIERKKRCLDILNIMNIRGEKKVLKIKIKDLLEHDERIDYISDLNIDEKQAETSNFLLTWLQVIEAFGKIQKKEKE